jgi:hypothetical protein
MSWHDVVCWSCDEHFFVVVKCVPSVHEFPLGEEQNDGGNLGLIFIFKIQTRLSGY